MAMGVSFDSILGLTVEAGASLGCQYLSPCGAEMWIWLCFLGGVYLYVFVAPWVYVVTPCRQLLPKREEFRSLLNFFLYPL